MPTGRRLPGTRTRAAALAAFSTVALTACTDSTADDETGTDVQDIVEEPAAEGPYEGPYDEAFAGDTDSYVGDEVVLSAEVDDVLSPGVFTIAGSEASGVDALLVVWPDGDWPVAPGMPVRVGGTVGDAFVITEVEEDLGVDLDDAALVAWEREPYVLADVVDNINLPERGGDEEE